MRLLAERAWVTVPPLLWPGALWPPPLGLLPLCEALGVPTKVRQQRTQSLPSRWLCLVLGRLAGQEELQAMPAEISAQTGQGPRGLRRGRVAVWVIKDIRGDLAKAPSES